METLSVKRGLVGNIQLLPSAKMLFVPIMFSLAGRLCSGGLSFDLANVIFAAYFILRGCDTHNDILRILIYTVFVLTCLALLTLELNI